MNWLDYVVLVVSLIGIAAYGIWHTRSKKNLNAYIKGSEQTPWYAIGLSVMATQASAITFLSTPGQGYLSGLGFIQIYFGVPIALVLISIFFLPNFHRLNVYTAYEFLGKRFDKKTRLLAAALFLLQRGLGAGLTIYAPAIVLTTIFGWPLNITIISCGLLALAYTVIGGSDAVTVTQKYQLSIIFAGMVAAACLLIAKLPTGLTISDTLSLAGGFHKLNAVSFSVNPDERYTLWSGLLGGTFLMLSYFGTDQSQVQRYISGSSLRESRLGLLFNAVCKIPMQFGILFLGVLMFLFYQFQNAPLLFDPAAVSSLSKTGTLASYEAAFDKSRAAVKTHLQDWLQAKHAGDTAAASVAMTAATTADAEAEKVRAEARKEVSEKNPQAKAHDADYVFINFILHYLPHGVIGLLVTAFFAAALSSKAAELNALATCTTIDFYRHIIKPSATDAHYVAATKWFTALWGLIAIAFGLYCNLLENLIQAVNIIGSIFYGVMLGLFVVAFFVRRVSGTAVFWAAVAAQSLIFFLYFRLTISYLWYPLIGCAACVLFSLALQTTLGYNRVVLKESES